MKRKKLNLGPNDVICLISSNEKQLVFVFGFKKQEVYSGRNEDYTGDATEIMSSHRHRICGKGGWNPLMLANYAAESGIILSGVKRFESYYKELIE
jgi:hypothetical protein